uniref:NusG domain II-containing protein n=1 Tax=Agathobacter sp. TaxID=2021311 RepID=UPI004055DCC0
MNKRFGKNDVIFLSLLAAMCIAVCVIIYAGGMKKGNYITITVDGKEYGAYSLLEDRTIPIGNPVTNTIVIRDGEAIMTDAECPDQLCVRQKAISYDKESIICLPNKIVVTVTGELQGNPDAVVN